MIARPALLTSGPYYLIISTVNYRMLALCTRGGSREPRTDNARAQFSLSFPQAGSRNRPHNMRKTVPAIARKSACSRAILSQFARDIPTSASRPAELISGQLIRKYSRKYFAERRAHHSRRIVILINSSVRARYRYIFAVENATPILRSTVNSFANFATDSLSAVVRIRKS